MPPKPTPQGAGWFFDFPDCGGTPACGVHYVVTPGPLSASNYVNAQVKITLSGSPEFVYKLEPNNTCDNPAKAYFYLQRIGDDMSGQGPMEFYRWWTADDADAFNLVESVADLTVALTPDKWISVFGKRGDTDATTLTRFQSAIANIGSVGLTFGGGCFRGHGVNVINGGARFNLNSYSIQ
jgi:hypothetical protein